MTSAAATPADPSDSSATGAASSERLSDRAVPSPEPATEPAAADNPDVTDIQTDIQLDIEEVDRSRWQPYGWTVLSGLLLWAAFYPLDWGPLGWVALIPLLWVATDPTVRRPYRAALLGGLVWAVPSLQWMRLASPPMYVAWLALASYLAMYLPAFVGLVRLGTNRLKLPLPLVAGVAWTGLELFRAHFLTGFAWYFLGHTQHRMPLLTQVADLGGAYAVSLLMATFAGLVVALWRRPASLRGVAIAAGVWAVSLGVVLGYGAWRLGQSDFPVGPRVALVQGNFTSSLKHEPEKYAEIWSTHRRLTGVAIPQQPELIIWPETMVRFPLFRADRSLSPGERATLEPRVEPSAWDSTETDDAVTDLAAAAGADLLLGGEILSLTGEGMKQTNAAYLVDPRDGVTASYGKLHRVPFGEYLPLGDWIPAGVRQSLPVPNIAAGERPEAFDTAGIRVLPLICFEDSVPHHVRRSVAAVGRVDLIANLTNDGWFHGSAELDQHLVSSQFRAIETRTPLVRAANTGISAIIDGNGRVLDPELLLGLDGQPRPFREGGDYARQFNGVLIGQVPLDPRGSLYQQTGDWLAGTCLLAVVIGLGVAGWQRRRERLMAADA